MTDKDDWLGIGANILGRVFAFGGQAAQDPELAKYQRAMPYLPLTKSPGHYLTGDEGSECKQVRPDIWNRLIDFKWRERREKELQEAEIRMQGIDTDEFKKQCEDIERGES